MSYNFLDLFAGAGGFTLGMESAGFRSIGAVEVDPVAAKTLEANFGRRPVDLIGPQMGDIRRISKNGILQKMENCGQGSLDLLIASPPCQGFSRVGRGKLDFLARKRGAFAFDQRNDLYEHAIKLLIILKPKVFLFENVTGILHLKSRNVAEEVCEAISDAGYTPRCSVLNSAWYGVPQTRERVIIIGVRRDLGVYPEFPPKRFVLKAGAGFYSEGKFDLGVWRKPEFFVDPAKIGTVLPTESAVSVSEAFDDLPEFTEHLRALTTGRKYRALRKIFAAPVGYAREPRNKYCERMRYWESHLRSDQLTDHFCRWTPRDFETFARMRPDDRYSDALMIARQRYREAVEKHKKGIDKVLPRYADFVPPYAQDSFEEKWRKLIPSQPSWTITAHLSKDTYSHIHFDSRQARGITIREAARIQSFPDAFRFAGTTGDAFRQIGNAVPPLMAEAIGGAVAAILARSDAVSGESTIKKAV